jgi:hypothetical protein
MGASDWAAKIFSWLAHAFISLIISLVIFAGTLIAAYLDFKTGMIIFWFGCLLTLIHQAYRMRTLTRGVEKRERVYASSLFSIAMNFIFGYVGAFLIYDVGMSTRTSSPLMAMIFPENAPFVFAFTAAALATLQIFLAVLRAALAYAYRSRAAQEVKAPAEGVPAARIPEYLKLDCESPPCSSKSSQTRTKKWKPRQRGSKSRT